MVENDACSLGNNNDYICIYGNSYNTHKNKEDIKIYMNAGWKKNDNTAWDLCVDFRDYYSFFRVRDGSNEEG